MKNSYYVVVEIIDGLRTAVVSQPSDFDTTVDRALELQSKSRHKYRVAVITWLD